MIVLEFRKTEFHHHMKIIFLHLLFVMLCIASCNKPREEKISFSQARYSVEVTGKWALPDFTVPAGVHFTNFVGMIHNTNATLWQEGKLATLGIENVAEVGSSAALLLEIDTIIEKKNALSLIFFTPPGSISSKKANFYCNSDYSRLSFISMIAPSPDWFTGLSNFNLYENQRWITDTTFQLFVYDAGTEEGDVFGYNNPPTMPQQNIVRLEASKATVLSNGNPVLKPIATIRLVKL
jgi:Spondin_N